MLEGELVNPSFSIIPLVNTGAFYAGNDTTIHTVVNGDVLHFTDGTYFVFVAKGTSWYNSNTPMRAGMYGCFASGHIQSEVGARVFIVQATKYDGMRLFGGPVEQVGRLKYIDGCTDSLLIPPVRKGDPCLNHLHFPIGINQTMHTHPSIRIGLVYRGAGDCITPWGMCPLEELTACFRWRISSKACSKNQRVWMKSVTDCRWKPKKLLD